MWEGSAQDLFIKTSSSTMLIRHLTKSLTLLCSNRDDKKTNANLIQNSEEMQFD